MNDTTTDEFATPTYEKGSWQDILATSEKRRVAGAKNNRAASDLLWRGAQASIADWLPNAATDVSAENLYEAAMEALGGKHRKGDASKIKTVAMAVKNNGLVLAEHDNLSKAYKEAVRLTKTLAAEKTEDDAAEAAVEAIAESAPKTATTAEAAAQILLSKGIDGAVVALLDALNGPSGQHNEAAHRSFMRAVSTEIAARVQAAKPKPAPKAPAAPKDGATKATKATPKQAAVKTATTKPKGEAATKAAPVRKAAPISASKGDPNKKALPPKAAPVKAAPVKAPAKAAPVKAAPVKR